MNNNFSDFEIDRIIPPEIKNDEFYTALQEIARQEDIKTVLEIGSSSGQGSTEAFVKGLRENLNKPILFCMEVSKTRFTELQKQYAKDDFVKCYNISSASLNQFPQENEIIEFYNSFQTGLNNYPLEQVLGWLYQDINYVQHSDVSENGIRKIKQENKIDFFDVVLIDGSEFTGSAELDEIYGARFICLDDINTFKNYKNHQRLLTDINYILIEENKSLRNGYSIFKRVRKSENFLFDTEKAEQLLVRNLVHPGMTIFDVGANVGDYSILFSNLVDSSGSVYAFEPTISTFRKLQERLQEIEFKNIFIFQKAIFSENIDIEFNEFPDEYSAWNSIGKPQMLNPQTFKDYIPVTNTKIVEAITLDSFCKEQNLTRIDYLKIDVEGAESDVLQGANELLSKKAISFIQFEISQKMLEGLNRKAIDTFNLLIQNGYECHRIKSNGEVGEEVQDSNSFYENYIAFPSLPIHFFTIVLNGNPFIRYHIDVLTQLPFKWHWHIVEGVAGLKHDTAWSLQLGGQITDDSHYKGKSNDGTTEYLDELAQQYSAHITIYRQPEDIFWDGKREMVNAPLENIHEECLLWQVDVDELWTVKQLCKARQMFIENPHKTAAFYWCWYFVGEKIVISTRNCYAQNPQQDWLRTWRYKPGMAWVAHEPPILVEPISENEWSNVAAINPFSHEETEKQELTFQHFAYVTLNQLKFKEQYYGYKNAVAQWTVLQEETQFPVLLREYFAWVRDETQVDTAESCGIVPIAKKEKDKNVWKFFQPKEQKSSLTKVVKALPTIILDGVFFQLYTTGIARVWKSLLEEFAKNGFAKHIIVLDRLGTAPKISGIQYRAMPPYDYGAIAADREMLQQVCDEEEADLFISTYYTTPLSTPSVFMAYDMIPEVLGADFNEPMWREKHNAIRHASAYIAISENTAHDLTRFFPDISSNFVTVAHCGVKKSFLPTKLEEVNLFKIKYGITKPYFLLVGAGSSYKNAILFFKAFSQLHSRQGFDIVCTGSGILLADELRAYTSGSTVHMLQLSDEEMRAAYSGAIALVYPSRYEGFGLPVLEAIACGCPVITCPNASIPEVAGEAALYINDTDVNGLANALCDVQKPEVRYSLITAGLEQAKKFLWSRMAQTLGSALINATLLPLRLRTINLIVFPNWSLPEESFCDDLEKVIRAIATHPDRSQITLLIDTSNISEEEATLVLSNLTMNLLMEEDLDVSEGPEISLVSNLGDIQWKALLTRLHTRIVLDNENKDAIAAVKAENLPLCSLNSFREKRAVQSEPGTWDFK